MEDRDLQQISKIDGKAECRLLQPRHLERLDELSGAGEPGRAKAAIPICSYL